MRSYASGPSSRPLTGQTVGEALAATAARLPEGLALVSRHQGVRLTWSELAAQVEEVALGLLAIGVEPGDRVGIWSPTRVEWTLLQFATARVGAILVNVNPAYRPPELAYALGQSGVRVLVTAPSFKTSDYVDMVSSVRSSLPSLERVIVLGPDWDSLVDGGRAVSVDSLRDREASLDCEDSSPAPCSRVACLASLVRRSIISEHRTPCLPERPQQSLTGTAWTRSPTRSARRPARSLAL